MFDYIGNCRLGRTGILLGTALAVLVAVSGCGKRNVDAPADMQVSRAERPVVFVSIPPQAAFVREIGGDRPEVHVMVQPGRSPATYEPTPKQMAALSTAHLYLKIGVPFEKAWMRRIIENNPRMHIVNTTTHIDLRTMGADHHHHEEDGHDHHHAAHAHHSESEMKDPHVWLAPGLVKLQAREICNGLKKVDPYNAHKYETNLVEFNLELDDLDSYIRQRLDTLEDRTFMVFHPSWGYFADAYGLEQVAVEVEGKEPGGKALAEIIERAESEGVRTIFVQPQFSKASAQTIADAVGAEVAVLDPLAANYFENMRKVADALAAKDMP